MLDADERPIYFEYVCENPKCRFKFARKADILGTNSSYILCPICLANGKTSRGKFNGNYRK